MSKRYPVIKIPALITNTQPRQIKQIVVSEDVAIVVEDLPQTSKGRLLRQYTHEVGYGLLFISALIFAVATAGYRQLLPLSLITFCVSIISFNDPMSGALLAQQVTVQKMPQIINRSETIPVDWQSITQGQIMPYGAKATAQQGVSERHFESYLQKYFGAVLHPGYEFKINEDYRYSSDFTLILRNGLSLIVEIDEPYEGKTNSPHHCTDTGKDDNRDDFFLAGNWIVIRFSELQVCAYPVQCCQTIAQTIESIDPSANFIHQFSGICSEQLPEDRRWNTQQAIQMAQTGYRLEYLTRYGLWQSNDHQQSFSSARKVSRRQKSQRRHS